MAMVEKIKYELNRKVNINEYLLANADCEKKQP